MGRARSFTRRAFVGALPLTAHGLAAGTGVSPAAAPAGQNTAEARVHWLAQHLADALAEHDGGRWFATIYPADYPDASIVLADIADTIDATQGMSEELASLICHHVAAFHDLGRAADQTDEIILDRKPSRDELRQFDEASEKERGLLARLCGYAARNDIERHERASYLLGLFPDADIPQECCVALLRSMTLLNAGSGA